MGNARSRRRTRTTGAARAAASTPSVTTMTTAAARTARTGATSAWCRVDPYRRHPTRTPAGSGLVTSSPGIGSGGSGRMAAEHGGTRLQSEVLEDLRGARHYRRWLVSLVAPYLGDHPIELGSGIGDYAAELAVGRSGYTATEPDPERLAVLTTRFAGHPVVRVRGLSLPAAERADQIGRAHV